MARIKGIALRIAALVLLAVAATLPARAQAVLVPAEALDSLLADMGLAGRTGHVNGPRVLHLDDETAMTDLGAAAPLVISLAAHRLADRGLIDLDVPVKTLYPALTDRYLFEHWPTARQLMTETGGFAAPPYVGRTASLDPYLMRAEAPGGWPRADMAGSALLAAIVARAGGMPVDKAIAAEVLLPLGLGPADWQPGSAPEPHLAALEARGSDRLLATLARLLTRNRDAAGGRYLSPDTFTALTERLAFANPVAPGGRTSGLALEAWQGRRILMTPPGCGTGFIAFPDADLTLVLKPGERCDDLKARRALAAIMATSFVPPAAGTVFTAPALPPRDRPVDGLFRARPAAPSLSLRARLHEVRQPLFRLHLPDEGEGYLSPARRVRVMLESDDGWHWRMGDGSMLVLDPTAPDDRFLLDGTLYERIAPTADPRYALWPVLFILPLLASGLLLRRVQAHRGWRFTGTLSGLALFLIGAGLASEWFLWAPALFDWNMPGLVTFGRIVLFAGLLAAMGTALMMLALLKDPAPPRGILARLHLLALGIAGLAAVILAGVWGLASSFSAY